MNTNIVIPIDFSAASQNAAGYAIQYSLHTNANLTLLYVWNINAIDAIAGPAILASQLLENAENNMQQLKQQLSRMASGKINISTQVRKGYFINQLIDCCNELPNAMVIMGSNVTTQTERIIFGSNTLSAMRNLSCPLIIVPNGIKFKTIHAVGMACDLTDAKNTVHTSELIAMLEEFHPVFSVMHVSTQKHGLLTPEEQAGADWLMKELAPLKPAFYHMQGDNVDQAIREFAVNHKLDLLIILPKKHGLFNRLMHKSQSKQMILNTHIPVMAIYE